MKYVNVAVPGSYYEPRNVIVAENTLISLFELIKVNRFGLMEASRAERKKKFYDYVQNVVKANNAKLFIDSGGYSIIEGHVPFELIEEFQEYYFRFMETDLDNCDFIFSLDVPWGDKEERLQNRDILYNLNYRIMNKTIQLMDKNPVLRDKFYFVYHFKMIDQHEIWRKLYEELDLGRRVIHRAIGGLVSLQQTVGGLDFTSFLVMIFRLFQDFLDSGQKTPELRIHILGVSKFFERLAITMAEEILNLYMRENKIDTEVVFTYDSISYSHQAWKKFKGIPYWSYDNGSLIRYSYHNVPNAVLQEVYGRGDAFLKVRDEIKRARSNQLVNETNAFVPLSIYSQKQLDDFLLDIVYSYGLLDLTDLKGEKKALEKGKIQETMNELKHNFRRYEKLLFSKQIIKKMENDLMILSLLRHFLFHGEMPKIEDAVRLIIELINYPDYLK